MSLGAKARFGLARVDGVAAAACLAVGDEGLLVLAAMRTLAEHRRRGAGRALLIAASAWGAATGAAHAYLQVDHENTPALALYGRAGFTTRYGYYYRARC